MRGRTVASILDVVRPKRIDDLLPLIGNPDLEPRLLAGGTDLLLKYRDQPAADVTVIDVTGIPDLSGIIEKDNGISIGSTTRLADVVDSAIVASKIPVLAEGAVVVAGPQIRNLATLGGNVCNASPSADTIPPLLVLDAEARILSKTGRRSVPLSEFFTGPGSTVLKPDELLEALWVPWPVPGAVAAYTKLSPRRAMDLAVVGAAVSLWTQDGAIRVRIGLGAVAPTPLRAIAAEAVIDGATEVTSDMAAEAGQVAAAGISPISDIRASAEYRTRMVERLVTRHLLELGKQLAQSKEGR